VFVNTVPSSYKLKDFTIDKYFCYLIIVIFSIITLSITTLSIMTLSIMTFRIMTLGIMTLSITIRKCDTQLSDT
jgi:hypothetical protein